MQTSADSCRPLLQGGDSSDEDEEQNSVCMSEQVDVLVPHFSGKASDILVQFEVPIESTASQQLACTISQGKERFCSLSAGASQRQMKFSGSDEIDGDRSMKCAASMKWKWNSFLCLWLLVVALTVLSAVAVTFCIYLQRQVTMQGEVVQWLRQRLDNDAGNLDIPRRDDFPNGNAQVPGLKYGVPEKTMDLLRLLQRPKRNARNAISSESLNEWDQWRNFIKSVVIDYHNDMPKIHLRGLNRGANEIHSDDQYLLWQQDPSSFHYRGVTLIRDHHTYNRIKAIEIEQPGVYLVYSQVVINGTNRLTYRRDCTHETVVLDYDDANSGSAPIRPRVLMSGFLTQDGQGQSYHNHTISFPRDSSLQMGLFRLHRQSQVRVQMPSHDLDCRLVNFATDVDASYFGLYRIA